MEKHQVINIKITFCSRLFGRYHSLVSQSFGWLTCDYLRLPALDQAPKQKIKCESKGAILKESLTSKQQNAVIEAAKVMGTFKGVNVLQLTLFLLETGTHPRSS